MSLEINKQRNYLLKKYLSPSEVDDDTLSLALGEVIDHPKGMDHLCNYVFNEMFTRGKPSLGVVKSLSKAEGISELAAQWVVNEVSKQSSANIDIKTEFSKLIVTVDTNIGHLSEIMETVKEHGADTDLDIQKLFAEFRMWLELKNKMIGLAMEGGATSKALSIEQSKADTLSRLSNEDLINMVNKLGEI